MLNEFPIFDYEDIQLIPNKCVIKSRAEADTSVTLGNHTFKLPVVPANMQTILDENVAEQLAKGGYFYIDSTHQERIARYLCHCWKCGNTRSCA